MLIAVANLQNRSRESAFAVNLACELAGIDNLATNRWQGRHSVILFTLLPVGEPHHYCEVANLPVSCEHVPLDDSGMERRIHRISLIAREVDYAIIDSPPYLHPVTRTILGISELVILPCSAADLEAAADMIELIRIARKNSSDGGPKCLLVPVDVEETTSLKDFETVLEKFGQTIGPAIRQSARFADCFGARRWNGDSVPDCPAREDIKSLAASVRRMTAGFAKPRPWET